MLSPLVAGAASNNIGLLVSDDVSLDESSAPQHAVNFKHASERVEVHGVSYCRKTSIVASPIHFLFQQ